MTKKPSHIPTTVFWGILGGTAFASTYANWYAIANKSCVISIDSIITNIWHTASTGSSDCDFAAVTIVRMVITLITGVWYMSRYEYTHDRIIQRSGFISRIFSVLIAVTGISGFPAAPHDLWWSSLTALVLLLGIEKDMEIIWAQRRQLSVEKQPTRGEIAYWQLLAAHHWYSCLRDLSMFFWWGIYGALELRGDTGLPITLAFGIPYLLLVILWGCLKHHVDGLTGFLYQRQREITA